MVVKLLTSYRWEVSRANWLRYAHALQYALETVHEDELFIADEFDEWNYSTFKSEIKNLKRFALEAAKRLKGYEYLKGEDNE